MAILTLRKGVLRNVLKPEHDTFLGCGAMLLPPTKETRGQNQSNFSEGKAHHSNFSKDLV